jgi:hypothetical protein
MSQTSAKASQVDTDAQLIATSVKRNGKIQMLPAEQLGNLVYLPTVRTLQSQFPSNMFAGAGKKTSVIPNIDFIKHFVLKVDLTISGGAAVLVPCNYWWSELAFRDGATNEIIQRFMDDSSFLTMMFKCSNAKQRSLFTSGVNLEQQEIGKYGLAKAFQPGTYSFIIPIQTSVFERMKGVYLDNLQSQMILDWTTPSTIVSSGSGTISSSTISFMVEGSDVPQRDIANYKNNYANYAVECQFLQPVRSEFLSQQMTAGQVNKLQLRSIDGLCAFQCVLFRPTGQINVNANYATGQWLNIGDANGASIDLTTSSGESILGNGSPIPTRYLRHHLSVDNFDNDFLPRKPVYLISYCRNVNEALVGRIRGGFLMQGTDMNELRITLPPAPVQEVQTITISAAPVAGTYYSFKFRGEESAQIAVASSTAVIAATIAAMREVASHNVTVVASAALSAGLSFTLTFTDPEGTLTTGDLFTVSMAGANNTGTTVRTTAGIPGLATGQYDIYVYSWLYNTCGYSNNKLQTRLLIL